MSNQIFENNDENRTGTSCEGPSPSRCSSAHQQQGLGQYPATTRVKWSREVNKVVMERFYRRKPFPKEGKPISRCRKRIFREWRETRMLESTGQVVCDKVRVIRKNGWVSQIELKVIQRQAEDKSRGKLCKE